MANVKFPNVPDLIFNYRLRFAEALPVQMKTR
jgi:hypothetical protein